MKIGTAAAGLAMAAAGAANARPASGAADFGLAGGSGGVACVATQRDVARFPQTVTIVMPGPGLQPAVLRGRIESALPDACAALKHAAVGANERVPKFYSLRLTSTSPQGRWNGIADFGAAGAARLRSCSSMEGMHFTAWSGRPLRSARLWHSYLPLGYDLESSNCKDREVE